MERERENTEFCCCCVPIRAGIFTLAILGSFTGVIVVLNGIASLNMPPQNLDFGVLENEDAKVVDDLSNAISPILTWRQRMNFSLGFVYIFMSAILLVGVAKKQSALLKLWVKIEIALIILGYLVIAALIFSAHLAVGAERPEIAFSFSLGLIFGAAVTTLVELYYMWVVYRYAKIVKEEEYIGYGSQERSVAYKA